MGLLKNLTNRIFFSAQAHEQPQDASIPEFQRDYLDNLSNLDTNNQAMASSIYQTLLEQRESKIKRGFYWENQIAFAYNSEKMEGNPLTKDQTRTIFETKTITGKNIPFDYVAETRNHFRLFDYMLDTIKEPLTPQMLLNYNHVLKTGDTKRLSSPEFHEGKWKTTPNGVGGIETTAPSDVPVAINRLFSAYLSKKEKTYKDIAGLHVFFERIHPFQDGNGRIGRILMFRECLVNNLVPFIVLDETKDTYYKGLQCFDKEPNLLVDYFMEMRELYLREYSSLVPENLLLPSFETFLNTELDHAGDAENFFASNNIPQTITEQGVSAKAAENNFAKKLRMETTNQPAR